MEIKSRSEFVKLKFGLRDVTVNHEPAIATERLSPACCLRIGNSLQNFSSLICFISISLVNDDKKS